jgi:maltooligosyltrehalose trehalohydrolase
MNRPKHLEIFNWHQSLIKLRQQYPATNDLTARWAEVTYDEVARWLMMERENILVICNFNERSQRIPIPNLNGKEVILSSEDGVKAAGSSLLMPKHSAAILAVKGTRNRS